MPSVKSDDTRVETFGIEVIVEDELQNPDSALHDDVRAGMRRFRRNYRADRASADQPKLVP